MSSCLAAGARSILNSATKLFAEVGFDCVSVARIAAHAGVSKANVFHHYDSKEALYLAVVQQASAEHADYAEELYQEQGSSADKVCKLIEFEIRHMLDNEQRTRLIMRESVEDGHTHARRLPRQLFQRNFTAVVNIFEQGRASGEFKDSIDPAAAAMLVGGASHLFFRCREALSEFRGTGDLQTPAAYAKRVGALILAGVMAGIAEVTPNAHRKRKAAA